jgi:hypothetical protein
MVAWISTLSLPHCCEGSKTQARVQRLARFKTFAYKFNTVLRLSPKGPMQIQSVGVNKISEVPHVAEHAWGVSTESTVWAVMPKA